MATEAVSSQSTVCENSLFLKICTGIPFLGSIIGGIVNYSIGKKISVERDKTKIIALIKIKDHYKISGIIRDIVFISAMVTIFALFRINGVAPITLCGVSSTFFLLEIAWNIYGLTKNRENIKVIEKGPFKREGIL
jgi:membrane protein YqaA with SNARE-associated domain